jgi:hypothetical protein
MPDLAVAVGAACERPGSKRFILSKNAIGFSILGL